MLVQLTFLVLYVVSTATGQEEMLFLVGRFNSTSQATGKVEAIDLASDITNCPRLQDVPLRYESVGTFIDDAVMVCGGVDASTTAYTNACFNYDPAADSWTQTYSMRSVRYLAAAVRLSPTKWWVTGGGNTGSSTSSTTEIFTVGEGFSAYVDLPVRMSSHNLVKINDTHIALLSAGRSSSPNAWIFNVETSSWFHLPTSPFGAVYAGLVTHPDSGKQEIVAVGSYDSSYWTEMLNLDTLTWRYGASFPAGILSQGASMPYGDTFLVVGGIVGNTVQDTIYKYETEGRGSWSLLPQGLATARSRHAAMTVPDGYVACA